MSQVRLYHNPRCSKSRAALALLREHGVAPQIVEYLKEPLTAVEIKRLLAKLGLATRDVLRDGEPEYAKLDLANPKKTEQELIEAIAAHPILLQRPIVERDKRAVIARPVEELLKLL